MRVGFKTTLEEKLISELKIQAIKSNINANDILEELISKFLNGEIKLDVVK